MTNINYSWRYLTLGLILHFMCSFFSTISLLLSLSQLHRGVRRLTALLTLTGCFCALWPSGQEQTIPGKKKKWWQLLWVWEAIHFDDMPAARALHPCSNLTVVDDVMMLFHFFLSFSCSTQWLISLLSSFYVEHLIVVRRRRWRLSYAKESQELTTKTNRVKSGCYKHSTTEISGSFLRCVVVGWRWVNSEDFFNGTQKSY